MFSSVQSLSHVRLFATPWIAACQASLSITISRSSLRLTSIKSVMPSSHLILGHPLLLLPPIPPSIRVFSNESTLRMGWPKYWSCSFSIIPSKEIPRLISFRMNWLSCPILCNPMDWQHARLPCPLPTHRACSNSYTSSQWCHPTISSSVLCPIRIAIIKKSASNKCWRGCGEKGNFLHCWWECKLI